MVKGALSQKSLIMYALVFKKQALFVLFSGQVKTICITFYFWTDFAEHSI
jgi:hypothetical protein